MLSVVAITPSTGLCRLEYAQSLAHLVGYFATVRVFDDQPRQNLRTDGIMGSGIGSNYDELIDKYLADDAIHWTHFLSIEDDMGFLPDSLHRLLRWDVDIVGANYSVNKGWPLWFTARKNGEDLQTTDDSEGLEEVDFLPQGFTVVKRVVYEKVLRPRFLNGYSEASGKYVSQDYVFCEAAKRAGFRLYVDHDVSKGVRHVGSRSYTYHDAVRSEELAHV